MAPKLKSVEVKADDGKGKKEGAHIFLPSNSREDTGDKPLIVLPEKDGVSIPMSPDLARELVQDYEAEDEDQEDFDETED